MANTPQLYRNGAVGFIDCLDAVSDIGVVSPPNREAPRDKPETGNQKKTRSNYADHQRITLEIRSKRERQLNQHHAARNGQHEPGPWRPREICYEEYHIDGCQNHHSPNEAI